MRRIAVVKNINTDIETVRQYLPSNYSAHLIDGRIVISGVDEHGWTMDGYVIPRLASGLIWAKETTHERK